MKPTLLYSLMMLSSSDAKRKKTPKPKFSDCLTSLDKTMPQIDGGQLKCRGHRCVVKCSQGMLPVGGKKIECRADRNKKLYLQPATMPKCVTCQPLEDLIDFDDYVVHTKKRRKGNLYTMSCQNQKNILPFNKFYLAAQCYCDKRKGECYWQGQGKINIQAQIGQMRCETTEDEAVTDNDMSTLASRPARITPGLTCDNKDRIVGGVEAVQHSWPWIVQLKYGSTNPQSRGGHTCSGTIIHENVIVTAAHCCQAFKYMEKLTGVVAEHSVINHIDSAYHIQFKKKIIHPNYRSWTLENDICLLIPDEPLNLHGRVEQTKTARACLPAQGEANPGAETLCWTAGWGRLSFKGNLANVLREVDVVLIDDQTCQNSNTGSILHIQSQKCAGHLGGGKDACQGDSGGPLICAENGRPILRGIVSGGIGCALPNNAGIYTRIENYITWINTYATTDIKAIRAHKNSLMNQRNSLTNREARQLQFQLITEGKVNFE